MSIPDTTLNTIFTGQQQLPGPIFEDGFESGDTSAWSITTGNLTGDSDSLVLPFTVTTTGMMTLREPLVIPIVAPTLPQWGLVLLTLVLLHLDDPAAGGATGGRVARPARGDAEDSSAETWTQGVDVRRMLMTACKLRTPLDS